MNEIEKYILEVFVKKGYKQISEEEYIANKYKDNYTYAYDESIGKVIYFYTGKE